MKKYTKVLALALALTMLLSMNVFAADVGYTVTEVNESGAEATNVNAGYFTLTADADDGKMYLLLVLDDEFNPAGSEPLSKSDILYVNQATASGTTVTFDKVYPSAIADSKIYLAGGSLPKLTQIALLDAADPAFILGDVNNDGSVTKKDSMILVRYFAGWTAYDQMILSKDAADVDKNGQITKKDSMILVRYFAGWSEYKDYFAGGN